MQMQGAMNDCAEDYTNKGEEDEAAKETDEDSEGSFKSIRTKLEKLGLVIAKRVLFKGYK